MSTARTASCDTQHPTGPRVTPVHTLQGSHYSSSNSSENPHFITNVLSTHIEQTLGIGGSPWKREVKKKKIPRKGEEMIYNRSRKRGGKG